MNTPILVLILSFQDHVTSGVIVIVALGTFSRMKPAETGFVFAQFYLVKS